MAQGGSKVSPACRLATAAGFAFGCFAFLGFALLAAVISVNMYADYVLDLGTTFEVHYSGHEAVMQDKAIVRGWVPPMLPVSAQRIRLRYELDSNWIRGSFEFAPTTWDPDNLKAGWQWQPLDYQAVQFPDNGLPRWWPESFPRKGVRYYHYEEARYNDGGIYFAVDLHDGEAWYWHKP